MWKLHYIVTIPVTQRHLRGPLVFREPPTVQRSTDLPVPESQLSTPSAVRRQWVLPLRPQFMYFDRAASSTCALSHFKYNKYEDRMKFKHKKRSLCGCHVTGIHAATGRRAKPSQGTCTCIQAETTAEEHPEHCWGHQHHSCKHWTSWVYGLTHSNTG